MFDFMLLDRPCFLYATDYAQYTKTERSTYFSITELPFELCQDNSELIGAISAFDNIKYISTLDAFKDKIGSFEQGGASQKILEWINDQ